MSTLRAVLQKGTPWAVRGGAVLLLLSAYLWLWRPARTWLTQHAARPLLTSVATLSGDATRATRFAVRSGNIPRVLRVVPLPSEEVEERQGASFLAPAGIRFLLPALFLIAAFPRRPYWVWLWLLHVGAGIAALAVLAAGVGGWSGGLVAYRFWNGFALDLFSLLVPLWMWLRARQGHFLPPLERSASSPPAGAKSRDVEGA